MNGMGSPIEQRFWAKVNMRGPMPSPYLGPCWLWTASLKASGYGQAWDGRRPILAHGFAYAAVRGPTKAVI
jgi:hypothetical protein